MACGTFGVTVRIGTVLWPRGVGITVPTVRSVVNGTLLLLLAPDESLQAKKLFTPDQSVDFR